MNIIISNASDLPIYMQIVNHIKKNILSGTLEEGKALPSIRALAKDLGISFITTKRAYEELEKLGLINTVPGKGCYVSSFNKELVYEAKMREIEEKLEESINLSKMMGLSKSELIEILESLYEGE
ncbi:MULTISPECIES: GntR family transcriptional regulator [Romboutsia]|uniref:Helix_turn_helix gluconate operon transcriptional repressor n=1 Tax=Romboutsia hominis TaxID=1507512 RepID=A0A2P2BQX6_9FIRM|nr:MULTISPECIES: GntR family transcriptional regulator [Romboutsia]MCH1960091.1 GntR family transcriptional regulator [Romboutsia hominis]MCH1969480.1 GntR family transcriptional regulator [Romboutsia hominis]MDB8791688.1 GntR family transcriptional regulator [Romboutsia sp. 1001216sp1]MDB8794632.1 GntR family transcriptional regulator [Romboutsia sp. 1001216sp1]MDB8796533.1 GntR family transcriptional regulator [Romboutsia sp. 1001216sp1]